MNDLIPLLDAGYEVAVHPGDDTAADGSRAYEVYLTTPERDVISAVGATPDLALQSARAEAMPRPPEAGQENEAGPFRWVMSADGKTWRMQLPDGRTAKVERLAEGDEDGQGAAFLPTVHESAGDFATGPVCAGLMTAGAWCERYAGVILPGM